MSFETWWKDYCRNHDSTPSFGTVFEAGCAESEAQIATLQSERDALREALVRLQYDFAGASSSTVAIMEAEDIRKYMRFRLHEILSTSAVEETMSHPPETSLELAKRMHAIAQVQSVEEVAALIDAWVQIKAEAVWGHAFQGIEEPCRCDKHQKLNAWVREREANAIEEAAQLVELVTAQSEGRDTTAAAIRALATASRKQLEEKNV